MDMQPLFPLDDYISTVQIQPEPPDMLEVYLGKEGAAILVEQYGGMSVFVPTTKTGEVSKKLFEQLGDELAEQLIANFGGEELYVPRRSSLEVKERHLKIKTRYNDLLKEGKKARSARQICAKEMNTTDRHVLRIVSGEYDR